MSDRPYMSPWDLGAAIWPVLENLMQRVKALETELANAEERERWADMGDDL